MNDYAVVHEQLVTAEEVDAYLEDWQKYVSDSQVEIEPMRKIRTGIFVQSLSFFNSTEVSLTGYIWQHYRSGIDDDIRPGRGEVGFVFPEQVASNGDTNTREAYRIPYVDANGPGEVIGWYFDAVLRQPFDYKKYPFDHKTAWIRMWHKEFWRNIVLVPDFSAYDDLDEVDEYVKNCKLLDEPSSSDLCVFGIDKDMVLGTWEREDTYFDYAKAYYDSDFGISTYVGQHQFPELRYNFVLKRNFENAFIVYLLPLLLVAMLLFAALLTVSNKEELSGRFGFNTSGFIGACSALFFVVLLAHIQLREQFGGSGIVYIENFYILMYILLVLATTNVYLFSVRPRRGFDWILYEDNMVFKAAYWPVVLSCLILITLGVSQ